jgi:hypothetical protein
VPVTNSSPDDVVAHEGASGRSQVEQSLAREAVRLLAAAAQRDVPMRLLGGMGIRLRLGERLERCFQRTIDDLDFIAPRRSSHAVEALLAECGWEPERRFNALNGARRLLFHDPESEHKIDVFVEVFEMCHTLPLAERISVHQDTLPAAELLMTKLQVVSLNPKDRSDLYALLDGCEVAEHDDGAINMNRVAQLTAADWGLHHTFELNFTRLRDGLAESSLAPEQQVRIERRIGVLASAIERTPKSRSWRMRARVGERKRWYEEPEEVDR